MLTLLDPPFTPSHSVPPRWPAWRGDRGLSAPCWRKRSSASSWGFSNLPSYLAGSTRQNLSHFRNLYQCGCSSISRPSNASGSFRPLFSGRALVLEHTGMSKRSAEKVKGAGMCSTTVLLPTLGDRLRSSSTWELKEWAVGVSTDWLKWSGMGRESPESLGNDLRVSSGQEKGTYGGVPRLDAVITRVVVRGLGHSSAEWWCPSCAAPPSLVSYTDPAVPVYRHRFRSIQTTRYPPPDTQTTRAVLPSADSRGNPARIGSHTQSACVFRWRQSTSGERQYMVQILLLRATIRCFSA